MTPEQTFELWHRDTANHALVWCSEWTPLAHGVKTECELCGRAISAWSAVVEWKQALPEYRHLLCRERCMALGLKITGPVPFGGRIKANKLPNDPARHKP